MQLRQIRLLPHGLAGRTTLIYFMISVLWLLITSPLLSWLAHDPDLLLRMAALRGSVLVMLTSILLYQLIRRGERQTQRSLNLLQAVIEGSSDVIFVKDLEGRYLLANSTTAKFLGLLPAEILGKTDYQLFAPDEAATIWATDRQIMANSERVTVEEKLVIHGQAFTFLSTKYPWRDQQGQTIGLVGVSHDITITKQLEQERLQLLQELQQRNRALEALNVVTANAVSTLELDVLLKTLLKRLVHIIPAQAGVIFLRDENELSVQAVMGDSLVRSSEGRAIALKMAQQMVVSPHILHIHDCQQNVHFTHLSRDLPFPRSLLGVPLKRHGLVIGVLQVEWDTPQPYDEQLVRLLEVTAERCVMAVLNAQLFKQTRYLQERLQLLVDRMPIGVMVHDRQGYFIEWNPAAEQIFGYTRAEVVHREICDLISLPQRRDYISRLTEHIFQTGGNNFEINANVTKDGRTILCEWHNTPLRDGDGAFVGVLSMVQDVTDREQAKEQLRESEARFRCLIDSLPFCCWAFDTDRRYTFQNMQDVQQWGNAVGLHQDEVIDNASGRLDIWRELSRRALNGEVIHDESSYDYDGKTQHFLTVGGPIRDGDRIYGVVGASIEITDRKQAEAQLRYYAFYDALTGLPQRNVLVERVADLMQARKMGDRRKFALLHLDLVRFKMIKYSLGHNLAEELLVAMAQRLKAIMPPHTTLARTGGSDEFAVLLDSLQTFDQATQAAEYLLQQLATPFQLQEHELYISASIGIVFSSAYDENHIQDVNHWFQAADTAMHQARQSGIGQYAVFDPEMQLQAVKRLQLDSELRHAVEQNELLLHYQPIIDLSTHQLTGFEALVRWQSPQRGMVSPGEFIPLAEETGLIIPLGNWVFRQACQQLYQWNQQFPHKPLLQMSVNLSTVQLLQPDLLDQIDRILHEAQISPHQLKLEITETSIVQNAHQATPILHAIRQRGIRLSIDDFGTGYSSLTYLHTFPLDTLKVDRAFVTGIGKNAESLEITRTIILLAHTLQLDVVAEGIETVEQMAQLQQLGCDRGQGYLFSRPLSAAAVEALLNRDQWIL